MDMRADMANGKRLSLKRVGVLATGWLCGMPLLVQGQTASAVDRFGLLNECRPMKLAVEQQSDDAKKIGLTRERLRFAVESRMRSARLYADSSSEASAAFLHINVNVVRSAFMVNVAYWKRVWDPVSEVLHSAVTWQSGSTGTHANDGGYIVQSLSEHVDRFLVEYLRVNKKDCGGP